MAATLQQILEEAAKLPPADARRILAALAEPDPPPPDSAAWLTQAANLFEEAMLRAALSALEELPPSSSSV